MSCSQCGTANADGAQFCSKCGAALNSVPASTNPAPAVPGAALQPPVCPAQSSGKALASRRRRLASSHRGSRHDLQLDLRKWFRDEPRSA